MINSNKMRRLNGITAGLIAAFTCYAIFSGIQSQRIHLIVSVALLIAIVIAWAVGTVIYN